MNLQGTKTWDNLHAAWAAETQAHAKYLYFANQAKKDGYEHISELFKQTAKNEHAHGEIWFKHIMNGIGDTKENLKNASNGEHYEWADMYAKYAQDAQEEGFAELANQFRMVAEIEHMHMERFDKMLEDVNKNQVFEKPQKTVWICANCGHLHIADSAPQACPVCTYPQSYFYEVAEDCCVELGVAEQKESRKGEFSPII